MADFDVSGIAGLAGTVLGIGQSLIEGKKAKKEKENQQRLFAQRKAFQTPKEVFDILNLTTSNTQGYSDDIMSYLTGQAGAGASAALGTAERLGADPNDLSGILDRYYQQISGIGNESQLMKMKQFDSVTQAIQLLAANKEAEWASRENMKKDELQAAAARLAKNEQGINSGVNLAVQGLVNLAGSNMYREKTTNNVVQVPGVTNIPASSEPLRTSPVMTPSEIISRNKAIIIE